VDIGWLVRLDADAYTDSNADSYTNAYTNADTDTDTDTDTNTNTNTNTDTNTNTNTSLSSLCRWPYLCVEPGSHQRRRILRMHGAWLVFLDGVVILRTGYRFGLDPSLDRSHGSFLRRHAYPNADTNTDSDTNSYTDTNANSDTNADPGRTAAGTRAGRLLARLQQWRNSPDPGSGADDV